MKHLKEEFDKLSIRDFISYSLAYVCMISGIVCIFLSLYIPPVGEIHSSVLGFFGIVSTFTGAILQIEARYKDKFRQFTAEVTDHISRATAQSVDGRHDERQKQKKQADINPLPH